MAFLLSGLITTAQQDAIFVIDLKTKEPVAFAHVCFEGLKSGGLKHYVTDIKGMVPNECKDISKLAISYVGYETLLDTVYPGKSKTVYLKPAILNMSEVVVTAQFTPERADRSIYRVNVINSKLIEQRAATNLTDLLSSESNMRISQGGVLGSSISMQGLSGENVKFLVDGIPVIGRMNGNIDLNQMNLFNVDHVEVIEGPMSVVYGSNAIAGVINIITKENKAAAFTSYANTYLESIGVYNFDGGVSKRIRRSLFSIDASRNFQSGYNDDPSERVMRWKPRRQYTADAYYLYSTEKLRLKFTGNYFNELLLDKGAKLAPYYESAFDNFFTTVRGTAKVESSYSPRKDQQWSLVAAYSDYQRVKNRYLKDLTTLEKILTPNADDQDTTVITNSVVRAWFNNNAKYALFNYQAGLDLNLETGKGKRIENLEQQIGDYAAFISLKYDKLKTLSVQPGARYIYNTKYKAPLVYSLNLKWNPFAEWTARLTYARGFRAPSLKELYLYFVDINHNVRGNVDLKAEYSHNVNFNLSFNKETPKSYFNAEAGLFYNNVNNNISLAPISKDLYTYINIGKYVSGGGMLNLSFSLYPQLTLKTGMSITGQSFAFDKESLALASRFWNKDITASCNYRFVKQNITISAFYKFSGDAPQVVPNDDKTISVGWVKSYNTLDVSVMRSMFQNHLTITAGGKNLFNVKTIPAVGAGGGAHSGSSDSINVAWGRTYFVKLSYNFNKYK
ncbi:MAG: TonB-dependent receptor [Bacteroidales bacterium]|nr:TonB-dependent receptor [Bacteroidales bacterium]